jgi:hypothetical protein
MEFDGKGVLEPDWNQERPSFDDAHAAVRKLAVTAEELDDPVFRDFQGQLSQRYTHAGGAYFAAFRIAADPVFDWFASRNRLNEGQILRRFLGHPAVRKSLPMLSENPADFGQAPRGDLKAPNFKMENSFLLDGKLAQLLYLGGPYWSSTGTGREEKELALTVCDVLFESRYAEMSLYNAYEAWAPWFKGIAWDMTSVLFDKRLRRAFVLVTTDSD